MRFFSLTYLLLLLAAGTCFSQDRAHLFKQDLHTRGIELLKELNESDRIRVSYIAFESAAALDPDKSVKPIIDLTNMRPRAILQHVMWHAIHFEKLNLALEQLDKFELTATDKHLLPRLAYDLGSKGEEIEPLLRRIEQYLRDLPPAKETQVAPDLQTLYDDRVEELCWLYHLGGIQNQPLRDTLEIRESIQTSTLKDSLAAVWILKAIAADHSLDRIEAAIETMDSNGLLRDCLIDALRNLGQEKLQSKWGNRLVYLLIESHASVRGGQDSASMHESFVYDFDDVRRELHSIHRSTPFFLIGSEIRDLYEKSKLSERMPDLRDKTDFEFLDANQDPIGSAEPWPVNLSLVVGGGIKIEPPTGVDPSPIVGSFEDNMARAPEDSRARWIINFVVRASWQHDRFADLEVLPESKMILSSFKSSERNDPKLAELIAKSLQRLGNSATEDILIQMMNSLPEKARIVTQAEVDSYASGIRNGKQIDLREALIHSMSLVNRSKDDDRWKTATKFALEFALLGDENAVNQLLSKVDNNTEKAWACFQCSIAFPPRSSEDRNYWYSCSRYIGGAF